MVGRERGQAFVMIVVVIVVVACVGVALASIGVRMAHRAQAQSAADAAALAGAGAGRAAAARVAASNGASLVAYDIEPEADGVTVLVVVEVGGERASSRASTGSDMRETTRSDH